MKSIEIYNRVIPKSVALTILFFSFLPIFAQNVLSQDDLIDKGTAAYNSMLTTKNNCIDASIYLFAYIQLNPDALSSDKKYAQQVKSACSSSFNRVSDYNKPSPPIYFTDVHLNMGSMLQMAQNAYKQKDMATGAIYYYAYMERGAVNGQVSQTQLNYFNYMYNQLQNRINYNIEKQQQANALAVAQEQTTKGSSYTQSNIENFQFLPKPHHSIKTVVKNQAIINNNRAIINNQQASSKSNTVYNDFSDAFAAVFNQTTSNFENMRGDAVAPNNYNTTIGISNASVVPSNIFFTNNTWAFRFTLGGTSSNEETQFKSVCTTIEQVLTSHGLKYTMANQPYNKGDVPLASIQYKATGYLIEINRAILGTTYFDEVIIYRQLN